MSQAGILNVLSSNPQIPTTFDTDSGSAIPIANTLNILGSNGIATSASGSTVTIAVSPTYVGQTSITTLGTITTGVWNGTVVGLAYGGTNANLTASNGGIFYSTAAAGAILSGTATAGQIVRSGSSAAPSWSTATYPATTTVNRILYSSSANVIGEITTANSGVLTTSSGGVPSIDTTNFAVLTTGVQMKGNNTNTAPPVGFIGESISSSATAVAMVSNTAKTLTSISLTAGVWDVCAIATSTPTGGAAVQTAIQVGISTTNNTITGTVGIDYYQNNLVSGESLMTGVVPHLRVVLSATTTYYLIGFTLYTSTTCPFNGRISATRVG